MPIRKEYPSERVILRLKSEGLSFTEISSQLCLPRGSVAGRYYRLKGVQHPSQVKRDERLKDNPRRDSLIFTVHLWNPMGAEPITMAEVLNRHKDVQYSSRIASQITRH